MIGEIHVGDNLDVLRKFPDNHFHSVVTDSPYGLGKEPVAAEVLHDWLKTGYHEVKSKSGFMGKEWDSFVPQPLFWKEVFRVLRPGGHLLSFFSTRTFDWGVMAIRLAGFEIRDQVDWIYGSGFPKSMDASKAIDKSLGAERLVIGQRKDILKKQAADLKNGKRKILDSFNAGAPDRNNGFTKVSADITGPATDGAKEWDGWGTALKPAHEPIVVARKPVEGTIAENLLKWGTGVINIEACRIPINPEIDDARLGGKGTWKSDKMAKNVYEGGYAGDEVGSSENGRFPANLILDSDAAGLLDWQSGILKSGENNTGKTVQTFLEHKGSSKPGDVEISYGDIGGASRYFKIIEGDEIRFFYEPKASRDERNAGLEGKGFEKQVGHNRFDACAICGGYILQNPERPSACKCAHPVRMDNVIKGNFHPTVKPVALMQWLIRLVTPKNGIVLDPFAGSGTTGCAAEMEEIKYVLIEKVPDYVELIKARCAWWNEHYYNLFKKQPKLFDF